jgi:PAS domain S-box-containing protein
MELPLLNGSRIIRRLSTAGSLLPMALVHLVRKGRDLPLSWIFWMFGLFVVGFGNSHLLEVRTTWHGFDLLSGLIKASAATVSVAAAVLLVPLLPKAGALPIPEQVSASNHELQLQALEAQTLMLQSVLDNMVEGLAAVDEQGNFILWNTAAGKIVGQGPPDVSCEKWAEHCDLYMPDRVTPVPPEQNPLVRAVRGEASSAEMFLRNRELGDGVWIEANAGPLRDRNGVGRGGVIAFRDISQRRADERKIREINTDLENRVVKRTAQLEAANQELEAFTYSISHDLRAPLRHIAGFSRILIEDFGPLLPAEARAHVQRIEEGVQRIALLVDELLKFGRVGRHTVRLQSVPLNPLVEEVISLLQPAAGARVIDWKTANLPSLECDPVLMKQVFQNLLSNALKFTRPRDRAVIEIGYRHENGETVVFVRDNGVGFNMQYQGKLFGVFQRLHRAEDFEGTGIGLATVQRIVQKHGGRVWAEAELDKVATFYFTVPNPGQSS